MAEDSGLLINLKDVTQRIMLRHSMDRMDDRPAMLCRYVTIDTFRKMAPVNEDKQNSSQADQKESRGLDLLLFDAETMNDPKEGLFLLERSESWEKKDEKDPRALLNKLFKEDLESKEGAKFNMEPIFICSFSTELDSLDLWRFYCNGHGACLKFTTPEHMLIYSVAYSNEIINDVLSELAWVIDPIIKQKSASLISDARKCIKPLFFLFKPKGHMTDREFRLIKKPQSWDDIKMFDTEKEKNDTDINRLYIRMEKFFFSNHSTQDEVILGPLAKALDAERGNSTFLKEIKWRLCQYGRGDIPVRSSKHSLRY